WGRRRPCGGTDRQRGEMVDPRLRGEQPADGGGLSGDVVASCANVGDAGDFPGRAIAPLEHERSRVGEKLRRNVEAEAWRQHVEDAAVADERRSGFSGAK